MTQPFALVPTRVPPGNIRVPEHDFEVLYAELMLWHDDVSYPDDPYILGIEQTLAWVADRRVIEDGKAIYPHPPLGDDYHAAEPERITELYLFAVETYARGGPDANQRLRGVIAALDWVWNGNGVRPLPDGWLTELPRRRR